VNSIGRRMVVNGILLSSTYFFTSIWGGTQKRMSKLRGVVANYFLVKVDEMIKIQSHMDPVLPDKGQRESQPH
jgi:hypothetical protein